MRPPEGMFPEPKTGFLAHGSASTVPMTTSGRVPGPVIVTPSSIYLNCLPPLARCRHCAFTSCQGRILQSEGPPLGHSMHCHRHRWKQCPVSFYPRLGNGTFRRLYAVLPCRDGAQIRRTVLAITRHGWTITMAKCYHRLGR